MELKKVRRGMHVRLNWPITRAGLPEDFSDADAFTLHISSVNNSSVKTFIHETHYSIIGNVISFIVTAEMLVSLTSGDYKATVAYRKLSGTSPTGWEPSVKDTPCFTLVDSSTQLGGTTAGIEVETVELEGEVGVALQGERGASAYQVAVNNGFEGDEAEWLYSLKKPAIDAAMAAAIAERAANDAAALANEKAELANTKAGQAGAAAEFANTEGGKATTAAQEANDAAQAANAAKESANTAASSANAAANAQNSYNITTAIPLAAGSYYTKTTGRAAVPIASRKLGLVLTYATAANVWYTERFIGSNVSGWTTESNWEQVPDKAQVDSLRADLNILNNVNTLYPAVPVYNRILSDTGSVRSKKTLNSLTQFLLDLRDNTKLLFCPELAVKLRTSGVNNYVTKLYDVSPMLNDGTQTTALNQPFLSGDIAPNEKYAIKNPNGGNNYITHTPISFSATDKWSATFIYNNFNKSSGSYGIVLSDAGSSHIRFQNNSLYIFNNVSEYTFFSGINKVIGKYAVYTITAQGDGKVNLYLNGVLVATNTFNTGIGFARLFSGNVLSTSYGAFVYYSIRDIALSPTQVQDEYNYLRTLFPEIESVAIGTQTWATSNCEMTCTPQGNVIPEMKAAANVEKITNVADREFSSDTGFWTKNGNGTSISGGSLNVTNSEISAPGLMKYSFIVIGNVYRVQYTINSISSGSVKAYAGNLGIGMPRTAPGTYTDYIIAKGDTIFRLYGDTIGQSFSIDNVSVQEVGWSDSTNLYNYIYANTSGTAEQKDYAAVTAAAMWRNVNNDPVLSSVYGKKFNKYAKRLLAMDIAYYNAANPTALWGWDIPTRAQLTTLAANGGNALKVAGSNYWNTANGNNATWFSLLGGGYIDANGVYVNNKAVEGVWCKDADFARVALDGDNTFNEVAATTEGYSIRLIKV